MQDDPTQTNDRPPGAGGWLRRVAASAVVVIAAGVLMAACGSGSSGPGVASVGSSPSGEKPASAKSVKSSLLAFSRCMRAHGVPDFPDPNSSGGLLLQAHAGGDLDPKNPRFQAATQACRSLAPKPPTSGPDRARVAGAMLDYARCMRAHGTKDFPDPSSNGQLALRGQPGGDLDPNNPQFQSADKACHSKLPGGGGTRQTKQGGAGGQ